MAIPSIGVRFDPVLSHNFVVALIDSGSQPNVGSIESMANAGFSECSGLEMTLEIQEHEEGGNNGTVLRFPTRVKWANLVLKRGIVFDTELWSWHYSFAQGTGKRRDGLIFLLDDLHVPHAIWCFRRGLPVKYSGPTLHAYQNNVAVESLEIAHEGLERVPVTTTGGAALAVARGS